jgi:hypothetical protein
MDTSIGHVSLTVSAVDDRTLLSPDVMEVVVAEVIRRLDAQRSSAAAQREERSLWPSVRSRGSNT